MPGISFGYKVAQRICMPEMREYQLLQGKEAVFQALYQV
jgi:hypothetical protein